MLLFEKTSHLRKGVHCSLYCVAGESLHGVEGVGDKLGSLRQGRQGGILFLHEAVVRLVSRSRRICNNIQASLQKIATW